MKTIILIMSLTFICNAAFSQVSLNYYNAATSKIGVGYSISEKFRSEIRLNDDTIVPEVVLCYNFIKRDHHKIYFGVGVKEDKNANMGLVIPSGVQVSPFKHLEQLSLMVELLPSIGRNSVFESALGIKYRFMKSK